MKGFVVCFVVTVVVWTLFLAAGHLMNLEDGGHWMLWGCVAGWTAYWLADRAAGGVAR